MFTLVTGRVYAKRAGGGSRDRCVLALVMGVVYVEMGVASEV